MPEILAASQKLVAAELSTQESGTAQGSVLSPLLGRATLIRDCDDFIIGFEHEDDARPVMGALPERSLGNALQDAQWEP